MSMQVISQDHYTTEVVYGPGRFTYDRDKIGTRYVFCSSELAFRRGPTNDGKRSMNQ